MKIYKECSEADIEAVAKLLQDGQVVALPTETVYGLGANGLDEEAIARIYEAKNRPSDNPLILHVASADMVPPLVTEISPLAQKLMDAFWPGPLTLTLPKSDLVPYRASGGLERVALRCPDHELCRQILEVCGLPIAAPSANLSGRPSPTTADDVYRDMKGRIAAIVDGGPCPIGVESTVVEVGDDSLTILRPGGITVDMLKTITPNVALDPYLHSKGDQPKAPGMKYKHYAPNAQVEAYVGPVDTVAQALAKRLAEGDLEGSGLVVSEELAAAVTDEFCGLLSKTVKLSEVLGYILVYGKQSEPEALARCLYRSLLEADEAGVERLFVEGMAREGMGLAIMNRLEKATAGRIHELT